MDQASLSAQRREEGSRIRSSTRYGGGGAARGRSAAGVRPTWYRALGGVHLWRKPAAVETPAVAARGRESAPLWRSSLKAVGAALARLACICKPACSGVHADALAPRTTRRRKEARSGGRSPPVAQPAVSMPAGEWENWKCVLLGMSPLTLDNDVLVRRLVLEEEYATRRRVEMQAAAKRSRRFWFPPGPSRLSQMSQAEDGDDGLCGDDGAGESSSSTSPQCNEDQHSL